MLPPPSGVTLKTQCLELLALTSQMTLSHSGELGIPVSQLLCSVSSVFFLSGLGKVIELDGFIVFFVYVGNPYNYVGAMETL